jgi:hypothetical protein
MRSGAQAYEPSGTHAACGGGAGGPHCGGGGAILGGGGGWRASLWQAAIASSAGDAERKSASQDRESIARLYYAGAAAASGLGDGSQPRPK